MLYDSKDLVTHALCVGMTGSGKTGLGIALIEEAAIDGVPAIVIDPKGDLTNLLLTFPELQPGGFRALGERRRSAARRTVDPEAFAAEQAARWRRGLAEWGEDGARIAAAARRRRVHHLHARQHRRRAGVGVQLVRPPARGRPGDCCASGCRPTVSSLLALAGIDGEPLKSREHILLSTILLAAWQAGESPDLAALLQRDSAAADVAHRRDGCRVVLSAKERFAFAMSINALLASPGFEVWSQGEPLDVGAFLRTHGRQAAGVDLLDRRISTTASGCSSSRCCSMR